MRHIGWLLTERFRHLRVRVYSTNEPSWNRAARESGTVSFDVFDTALLRCVTEPADVFEIVGFRLREKGLSGLDPSEFKTLRQRAETAARLRARDLGRADVTLEEIHVAMQPFLAETSVAQRVAEELAVETAALVENPDVRRAYEELRNTGKPVVFVSDTYFSARFIAERLEAAGYGGSLHVFASCERGATKESGALFDVVARETNTPFRRIVHLGDNRHADVVRARARGIRAHWYRPVKPRTRFRDDRSLVERIVSRNEMLSLARAATEEERTLASFGAGVMAPIFLGFTQWLVRNVAVAPPGLVLFCARDAYLVQRMVEAFGARAGFADARYFAVSRRALNVPSIERLDSRALDILCGNNAPLPIAKFFSRIGLEIADYESQALALGLTSQTIVDSSEERARLRALFTSIGESVIAAIRPDRALLLDYCSQSGVFDGSNITVVDIGWGGSLQASLAAVLASVGPLPRLRGCYVSTDGRVDDLPEAAGHIESWLCHGGKPVAMQEVVSQGYWMLEMAFAAPHGTVLGYERDGDSILPVFQEYDPCRPEARAGKAFQAHALAFAERWRDLFDGFGPDIAAATAFRRFASAVDEPSVPLARFFGDIVHVGGLGESGEDGRIAKPPSLMACLRNPRVLLQAYRYSHWRRGFLTRVFRSYRVASSVLRAKNLLRILKKRP